MTPRSSCTPVEGRTALSRARKKGEVGAIYVEFMVAIMPIITFFFCLVQLALVCASKLIVDHAAVCATRAAIVILHDNPQFYEGQAQGETAGKRRTDIELAAAIPLLAGRDLSNMKVTFPSSETASDDKASFAADELVRVRVEADYSCQLPLANRIVCNPTTRTVRLRGEAAMPNQGVAYPPIFGTPEVNLSSEDL